MTIIQRDAHCVDHTKRQLDVAISIPVETMGAIYFFFKGILVYLQAVLDLSSRRPDDDKNVMEIRTRQGTRQPG